jgi:hypothetical protein
VADSPRTRTRWRLLFLRNGLIGVFAVSLLLAALPERSSAAAIPGSAGIDTSLPSTPSQVTVKGRGTYPDLTLTVNQTANLTSQAISVSWTGGTPTIEGPGRFGQNYLQLMQCWSDDDGPDPTNPGPPPEQCVSGAADGVPGGGNTGALFPPASETVTRVISRTQYPSFDRSLGYFDSRTGYVWRPFRAADGTQVDVQWDPTFNQYQGGNYWLNPYFDVVTSNEIAGAITRSDGTGQELFQVNTGVESSGLGCGQRVTPAGGGEPRVPKCWLVVVPRGTAADENVGTGYQDNAGVMTSPLSPAAWANRIAIPLEFNPVDPACDINRDARRIAGTELAVPAVVSWQPTLCASAGLPPYTYSTVADVAARQQLAGHAAGAAPMAVTSAPLSEVPSASDPTVYAPLTLSGGVIGFNLERIPSLSAPPEESALAGIRVADINLTPRLLAKLLTQSYSYQVSINSADPGYDWLADNPRQLGEDPDFLRFNPEFELLQVRQWRNFGGLLLQSRNSDLAAQLWGYILADPEAKAWLDGSPDEWGMRVNPLYATTDAANSTGTRFGDPVPESFPKADPFCYQAPPLVNDASVTPPALCGTDWLPYVQSLDEAGRFTRIGDDRAKITLNPFAPTADQAWKRGVPQQLGQRAMLSITDTASAARYGLQAARLSRAGDNGSDRAFVSPQSDSMQKAVSSMKSSSVEEVLVADPSAEAPGAYPLTMLSYAAIKPVGLDDAARADYAAFLRYAAGDGQVPGSEPGRLPVGFAALPDALVAQTRAAADSVLTLQAPPESSTVTPPPSSASPRTGSSGSVSTGRSASTTTPTTEVVPVELAAGNEAPATTPQVGPLTPILALARSRFFLVALAGLALACTLAALEITKRPRRPVDDPEVPS